ncbi:MAG: cache domain-containing protein, partial [Caldimicrobium sp.]
IIITDKSGTAGIAYWINTHFKLTGDKQVDKRHPGVVKIYKKIQEQYEKGRITPISNEEMLALTKKHLPELFESELDYLRKYASSLMSKIIEDMVQEKDIISFDLEKIRSLFKIFLEEHPYVQFIYIVDTEGRPVIGLSNNLEYKKKFEELLAKETFEDRPWFINPLKNGKIYVSNFYTSKVTDTLCITVSAPIRNEQDEILGILGMDIRFEDLVKMEGENDY